MSGIIPARAVPEFEAAFELQGQLRSLRENGLLREPICLDSAQGARVHIGGREFLNFCSNDYLGLAADPRVAEALCRGAREFGTGSGASALVCGRSRPHLDLERGLSDFVGRERVLLFSSGYLANLAAVSSLMRSGAGLVLEDRLNHASLLDAAVLARARFKRYAHADPVSLQTALISAPQRKLVLTDTVFSMDGDICPLREIAGVCAEAGALFMVDDAHGFGVLGDNGRGALEQAGLNQKEVPLLVGTFGKALGTGGAFIAGPAILIETLIQFARPYIYTTAPSPALAYATSAALQILIEEGWRREKLRDLVAYFRAHAGELGIDVQDSHTAIQPLIIGAPEAAVAVSGRLRERGILITAIRPPTVPRGSARLRITLSAAHEKGDIDQLLRALVESLAKRKPDACA